jgi:hypothetical protein
VIICKLDDHVLFPAEAWMLVFAMRPVRLWGLLLLADGHHSPQYSPEVNNLWSCKSSPPHLYSIMSEGREGQFELHVFVVSRYK